MFVANIFERRLNSNMRRHALNAKIAPPKPKPNCRAPIERRVHVDAPASIETGADLQLLNSFLATAVDMLPSAGSTIVADGGGVVSTSVSASASVASMETLSGPLLSLPAPTTPADCKPPQLVVVAAGADEVETTMPLISLERVAGAGKMQLDAALKLKTTMSGAHAAAAAAGRAGSMESVIFTDSDIDAASNVSFVA